MRVRPLLASLFCISASAMPAYGDCPGVHTTRVFANQTGTVILRADVAGAPPGRSLARLSRFTVEGERLLWTATLVNVPPAVWIDSGGRWLVTLGNYCNSPSEEHALTVYDRTGQLIADWTLRDLVPDFSTHVTSVEVDTSWTSSAGLRFESTSANELRVVLPWGESKVVSRPPVK
jgi:hypothetical protein